MNVQYRHLTIAAAGASLLAAAPLAGVFRTYTWFVYALGVVVAVLVAALVTRAVRTPLWGQFATMMLAWLLLLSWLFGAGTTIAGVVPTPTTIVRFTELLTSAGVDARELAAPVPDTNGLLFTVAASVGLVAILVDMVAVGMRQPALAGLPMLAIYSVPVAVLVDSVSWLSFAFTAAGFLWLLVADHISRIRQWGRRFADNGRDVDAWESSPLAAAGRRLGLVGIVAAVVLPLAVPGMTAGLLERLVSGTGLGGGPGVSDGRSIDPIASMRGNLTHPDVQTMLKVTTEHESPGYLRLAVADLLTDRGAVPRSAESSRVIDGDGLPAPKAEDSGIDSDSHKARIRILNLEQGYLPAYPNTVKLDAPRDGRWYRDDSTSVVWSRSHTRRDMSYDLEYLTYDYSARQLRNAGEPDEELPRNPRYYQVPSNPTVDRLANRLTDGEDTQYDRVLAILNHFSKENGFRYSTTVKGGTSGSAVVDFLENKQGYCQQYAVSMTWLLRSAGIPSRVAIGFTQGIREPDGFTIRNWDAHAWVEVYFQGIGWVPFDPTPATGVYNDVPLQWAPNPYEPPADDSPTSSAGPDASASPAPTATRPDRRNPGEDQMAAGGGNTEPPARWPYWTMGILVLLALLSAPGVRRAMIRRRRLGTAADGSATDGGTAAAHAAWDELLDTLVDLDIDYQASDTPRGVARRLRKARPPLIQDAIAEIELLAQATERAEYSRQPLPGDGLDTATASVCRELRTTATRWVRLTATVYPASVTRLWRERLVQSLQATSESVARSRAALGKRIPGRRRDLRV